MSENQYEIYLPGKKDWVKLEDLHVFLKYLQRKYHFFDAGHYYVTVITNSVGTLFQIEQLEKYIYKRSVDLRFELHKTHFYIKSREAFVFQKECYYYHEFFYGTSNKLITKLNIYDFVEIISEGEYQKAIHQGILLKKRRDFSSL